MSRYKIIKGGPLMVRDVIWDSVRDEVVAEFFGGNIHECTLAVEALNEEAKREAQR